MIGSSLEAGEGSRKIGGWLTSGRFATKCLFTFGHKQVRLGFLDGILEGIDSSRVIERHCLSYRNTRGGKDMRGSHFEGGGR
ncbi:MAG: hypothetical protein JOZ43_07065 [Acidobacteriales bacterium]|nr:hypothetical protein [Terriglobales bacterium]